MMWIVWTGGGRESTGYGSGLELRLIHPITNHSYFGLVRPTMSFEGKWSIERVELKYHGAGLLMLLAQELMIHKQFSID